MAFKMTPGIRGNSSMNRIKNLGACGGPGQPPCEPRFQAEKTTERAPDRSFRARATSSKKAAVVAPPPRPPKLKINLPKGYEFGSKKQEAMFYEKFSDLSEFKSQEELDAAVARQLKGGEPKDPEGPVIGEPVIGKPVIEGPVVAEPVKGVDAVKGK